MLTRAAVVAPTCVRLRTHQVANEIRLCAGLCRHRLQSTAPNSKPRPLRAIPPKGGANQNSIIPYIVGGVVGATVLGTVAAALQARSTFISLKFGATNPLQLLCDRYICIQTSSGKGVSLGDEIMYLRDQVVESLSLLPVLHDADVDILRSALPRIEKLRAHGRRCVCSQVCMHVWQRTCALPNCTAAQRADFAQQ
jgi:hypothetical protein